QRGRPHADRGAARDQRGWLPPASLRTSELPFSSVTIISTSRWSHLDICAPNLGATSGRPASSSTGMSAALPHRCSLLREGARALELVLTPVEGGHRREVWSHHAVHRLPEGHRLALARNLLDGCEPVRRDDR